MSMRTAAKAALWCSMALIVPTALALPCGSLIFWLSSSCLMIGWVRAQPVRRPPASLHSFDMTVKVTIRGATMDM